MDLKTALPESLAGPPGTCAPPAAPRPGFLCFSSAQLSAAPAPAAGLRSSWEPGSPAGWPLGVSKAAASRSSGCFTENSRCSRTSCPARPSWSCCRVAAACSASSPPPPFHADPHLRPKNPFRTRILFRIKTLFLFVCFSECEQQGM